MYLFLLESNFNFRIIHKLTCVQSSLGRGLLELVLLEVTCGVYCAGFCATNLPRLHNSDETCVIRRNWPGSRDLTKLDCVIAPVIAPVIALIHSWPEDSERQQQPTECFITINPALTWITIRSNIGLSVLWR
jgi:hypothetical protein